MMSSRLADFFRLSTLLDSFYDKKAYYSASKISGEGRNWKKQWILNWYVLIPTVPRMVFCELRPNSLNIRMSVTRTGLWTRAGLEQYYNVAQLTYWLMRVYPIVYSHYVLYSVSKYLLNTNVIRFSTLYKNKVFQTLYFILYMVLIFQL